MEVIAYTTLLYTCVRPVCGDVELIYEDVISNSMISYWHHDFVRNNSPFDRFISIHLQHAMHYNILMISLFCKTQRADKPQSNLFFYNSKNECFVTSVGIVFSENKKQSIDSNSYL